MSTYTTNLNLFKYTSDDHNQAFNYETALNDNWDKIDIAIEEISVDQTFDGTSTKAQSGVAINDAGFVQNTATGPSALTIGGTSSGYTGGTNIGISSQAKQNYGTAIGYNTNANGNSSTCIGRNAGTSAASAIQIGAGINSTANTLQVGFIHASTNYQLLDGTTGLIPDERISSTIARTSHSQASNTINALTGYVKPSVTSAISTADTLNVALGKLEKAIDSAGSSISITYEV